MTALSAPGARPAQPAATQWPPRPTRHQPHLPSKLGQVLQGQRPSWHDRAACRATGCDTFFVDSGGRSADAAIAVCQGCPVRQQCLEHAMAIPERHGVWGGLTPGARRQLARERRAQTAAEAERQAEAARLAAERDAARTPAQRVRAVKYQARRARLAEDPDAMAAERQRNARNEANRRARVLASDQAPAYLAARRAQNRAQQARRDADPDAERARQRASYAARRARLEADPEALQLERKRKAAEQRRYRQRRKEPAVQPEPLDQLLARADAAGLAIVGHVPGTGLVVQLPQGYRPEHAALADELVAHSDAIATHLVERGMAQLSADLRQLGLG